MRALILSLICAALCCACRSHKTVSDRAVVGADSIRVSESRGASFSLDSLFRRTDLSFDTLDVEMTGVPADSLTVVPASRIRIRMTGGHVATSAGALSRGQTDYSDLDSVALRRSSATAKASEGESRAVYDPPDTTSIAVIAIIAIVVIIGVLVVFLRRKRT